MKRKLWALGMGMALACSQSFAWIAIASDDYSNTAIFYGADTAEEATREAMKMCQRKHTGCEVGEALNGTAMVVAKGSGGWGHGADPSPEKAEARALAHCRAVASNCKVTQAVWDPGVRWGALAMGGDRDFHLRVNANSEEAAEADALAGCRKNSIKQDCAIAPNFTHSARLYYARARGSDSLGFGTSDTAEQARALALEGCTENSKSGARCTIERVLLNESAQPEPTGMARLRALAERNVAAASAAPPAPRTTISKTSSTNVLRCTNQCVNGSCIRTFENGRKERWNAPRVFNPSTRNWEWDITTNACGG